MNDTMTEQEPTPPPAEKEVEQPSESHSLLYRIVAGDALAGVLAVFLAFLVGSVMIAATDDTVRETASYVFARPSDFFQAVWEAVWAHVEGRWPVSSTT